jgi:hypothetical protein
VSNSNLPRERRLEDLERSVKFLTEQLNAIGRRGRFGYPLQTRLVKAVAPYEGDYPADGATVFPVRFLDGDFDPEPGDQTATYRERAAEERTQAGVFNLAEEYIEEGDVFPAFQLSPIEGTAGGRWWSYVKEGGTVKYRHADSSAGTQPVGAIMDVIGWDDANKALLIAQPTAQRFQPLWLIGGTQTTFGGYGAGKFFGGDRGLVVASDPGEGTASYGQMWGPKPGSWLAFKDREGFFATREGDVAGKLVAQQRFSNELLVKLRDDLEQGDKCKADVLYRTALKRIDSSFRLPELFDVFLNKEEKIDKKTIAVARYYCGRWCAFSAYCAPDDTDDSSSSLKSLGAEIWTDDLLFETATNNSFFD